MQLASEQQICGHYRLSRTTVRQALARLEQQGALKRVRGQGTYVSDEAETTLTVVANGDSLVIKRRPDATMKLTPIYADAFTAPQLGLVIFRRDARAARVAALSVVQERVWDLRFTRQPAPMKSSQ